MEYDIEAYLEGALSEVDRAAFEAELANNPVFREEVELQSQLRQRLKQQLLREQVSAALDKPEPSGTTPPWGPLLGVALLVAVGTYFLLGPKGEHSANLEETASPVETRVAPGVPPATTTPEEAEESVPTPPQEEVPKPPEEKQTERPIAQNNPPQELSAPLYPGPTVRGTRANDEAWKALIDALWYTDFPPANAAFSPLLQPTARLLEERKFPSAYVQLQRLERTQAANDTLRYLKGYCLLEMGEGKEALRYFDQLDEKLPAWKNQLEWYRALAYLISGEQEKAIVIFEKITASKNHSYHLESTKAVNSLK